MEPAPGDGEARDVWSGSATVGGSALCGRRADSSAFEYTRRAAELQAFRGNFFAETGIENAPKRKRTANAKPGPLGVGWGALEPTRQNFRFFAFFGGQVGRLASNVDLTFEKKTIMKG